MVDSVAASVGKEKRIELPWGQRIQIAMSRFGAVCVGIDPHRSQLEKWGLADDLAGLEYFSRTMVEAMAGEIGVVKPQSAFFERFGSAGIAILEQLLADCRAAGLLTILDVKRGDIGSTMAGYAQAYLGNDSPLAADAITVSPYLGFESLRPVLDLAQENNRGVYILALTSNPEGKQVQHALVAETGSECPITVAQAIINGVSSENKPAGEKGHFGSFGLVVGATIGDTVERLGIDLSLAGGTFLAPGIGAQGASSADISKIFGSAKNLVLASTSRGISGRGPKVKDLRAAARETVAEMAHILS